MNRSGHTSDTVAAPTAHGQGKRKLGFTLKELSIAMSLGTVLLGISISLIGQSFRLNRRLTAESQDEMTFFRLSSQWRRDIQSATHFTSRDDVATLQFDDGGLVRYTIEKDSMKRVVLKGDQISEREQYVWQKQRRTEFRTIDRPGERTQAGIVLSTDVPGRSDRPAPFWRKTSGVVGLRFALESGSL